MCVCVYVGVHAYEMCVCVCERRGGGVVTVSQFVSSMVKRYQDNQLLMNTDCCFCSLSAVW